MTVGLEDAVVMRSELLEDKVEEDARVSQEPQDTTEFPETKVTRVRPLVPKEFQELKERTVTTEHQDETVVQVATDWMESAEIGH